MRLELPILLLLAPLALAGLLATIPRRDAPSLSRTSLTARALAVLLLLVAAAGPAVAVRGRDRLRVWVIDVSASHAAAAVDLATALTDDAGEAWRDLRPDDRVAVILFDSSARLVVPPASPAQLAGAALPVPAPAVAAAGSDLGPAIRAAAELAAAHPGRLAEIVLATDGLATDGVDAGPEASARALAAGVPIFVRPPRSGLSPRTVGVLELLGPARVALGEPAAFDARVRSAGEARAVRVELLARRIDARVPTGATPIAAAARTIPRDAATGVRLVVPGSALARGAWLVTVRVRDAEGETPPDPIEADDAASAVLVVGDAEPALVVASDAIDPALRRLLEAQGLTVSRVDPTDIGRAARPDDAVDAADRAARLTRRSALAVASLIVLDDVSIAALGPGGAALLADLCRGGAGLLVLGGAHAFGPGGYAESPLEAVLPLHSDPEPGEAVHVVLALDTSGSMSESADPAGADSKLDRARAALRPPPTLRPTEALTVLPFAVAPGAPIALQQGEQAAIIFERTLAAVAPGGGTDVFAAIARARQIATRDGAETRRIVVLTDGETTESDAAMRALEEASAEDADTEVVLILVGERTAEELAQVERIAAAARGRVTRIESWEGLRDRLREEVAPSRGLVATGPSAVALADAGALAAVIDAGARWPAVARHIRTRAREGRPAVLTVGDREEPLLAVGPAGRGRSVAFTARLGRGWSDAFLADTPPGAAARRALGGAVAWARRRDRPGGLAVRALERGDGSCEVEASVIGAAGGVVGRVLRARRGTTEAALAESMPGEHRGTILPSSSDGGINAEPFVVVTDRDDAAVAVTAPVEPSGRREWQRLGIDRAWLATLAAAGGGSVLDAPAPIPLVRATAAAAPRPVGLRLPFVAAAVLVLLLEAGLRAGAGLSATRAAPRGR